MRKLQNSVLASFVQCHRAPSRAGTAPVLHRLKCGPIIISLVQRFLPLTWRRPWLFQFGDRGPANSGTILPRSSNPGLVGNDDHGAIGSVGARTPPILIRHGADTNVGPPPRVAHAFDDDDDDPFSPFVVKPISPVAQQAFLSVGRIPCHR
jgi:hypothetical protein